MLVSIVIDDLGDKLAIGRQIVALPGSVTLSFLPHGRYVRRLTGLSRRHHKEIILHLPMEAVDGKPLGKGGLTMAMTHEKFVSTLRDDLAAVPHAVGINNHMGGLLTQQTVQMRWLMEELQKINGLFFIDSRTTPATVAAQTAREAGIATSRRDIFLDNIRTPKEIGYQLGKLLRKAFRNGSALAIGHPYPETISVLEKYLPHLHRAGVTLVSVSRLIAYQQLQRASAQHISLAQHTRFFHSEPEQQ